MVSTRDSRFIIMIHMKTLPKTPPRCERKNTKSENVLKSAVSTRTACPFSGVRFGEKSESLRSGASPAPRFVEKKGGAGGQTRGDRHLRPVPCATQGFLTWAPLFSKKTGPIVLLFVSRATMTRTTLHACRGEFDPDFALSS